MTPSNQIMKRDIPDTRLHEMYAKEDYYWYLKSQPFIDAFLKPLGEIISKYTPADGKFLDVGCGEGWLVPFIEPSIHYVGIDASVDAIQTARKEYSSHEFLVRRLEEFPSDGNWKFDTVLFGGILDVLVNRDHHVPLIQSYIKSFGCSHVIVYDLARFRPTHLAEAFGDPVFTYRGNAILKDVHPVKLARDINVYEIQP